MSAPVLAVDIGGTKLAAGLVAADGSVECKQRRPTPDTRDPEVLWSAVARLLEDVVPPGSAPAAVGVGCGGPMRWPDGVVSPLNIPAWRDFPLADRLRTAFPGTPVAVHNDAVAMALGESAYGAGRGAHSLLGVVVSTGVGGGLVMAGRVLDGPAGNAGHIGHVVVDADGPACACGGRGCLEAVARGPALVAWAQAQGWRPSGTADGRGLVTDARAGGDPIAVEALARGGRALGVALASAVALLELDVVAVGGGIANAGDLLLGPARAAFERHGGLDFVQRCRIVAAALRDDAGLVGAGVLGLRALPGAGD